MARWKRLVTVALSSGWIAAASAQEVKIGLSAEPSSIDPHFHNLAPNTSMMKHIFDTLLEQDEQQRIKPRLALSWRTLNDTTWEFKLRPGVKFTDGSDFTANDVIYSFCRVPQIENSPSSMAINVRAITGMTAPDPLTLVVTTAQAHPLLPNEMSTIAILSAKANGAGAVTFDRQACKGVGTYPKTEAFNSGEAAIGTGPFKLVRYTKGDRIILERNEGFWGEKPVWQRAIFRPITSAGPRVAALLAGDVDLIENVPIQDLARVKSNPAFKVVEGLSNRVIYLHFDYVDEPAPGVADTGGKNPYRDKRVREAISKAIDRDAIVARIMGGVAVAAGELLPPVLFGANKDMKAPKARRRGGQEAPGRSRLSERLLAGAGDAQRPLRQRRPDRPGGGADADAGGLQGLARRDDAEPVLPTAQQARFRHLARRLGLGHRRDVVAAQVADGDAEPRQGHGNDQSGRLFQSESGRAAAARRSPPSTTTSGPRCSPRRAASPWPTTARCRCTSR